jgi:hypothetical protein
LSEKKFLYSSRGVDVDGTRDMTAVILVLEAAIDNMKLSDLSVVCAVQQGIQLQGHHLGLRTLIATNDSQSLGQFSSTHPRERDDREESCLRTRYRRIPQA